jgi:SurA N-terminal domain
LVPTSKEEGHVVGSRRLRRAAVAVLCTVALSGCASAHPGAAAQVGDVSISDQSLEQSASGFCELIDTINQAQQGTRTPVPLRTALLSALNTLVMGEALDQLAAQNDVEVTDAEIDQWISGLPLDFAGVPQSRTDDVAAVTQRVARNSLLMEKLGQVAFAEQNPGSGSAPPNQVQQLGQQMVNAYMQRVGVETDPRYGQVLDTQQVPGTGSLSIPVSQEGVEGQTVPEASNTLAQNEECA